MKQFDWNVGAAACRTSPITSLTVPQHVLATVPSMEKPLPSGVCTLEYSAYVPPPPANAEISTPKFEPALSVGHNAVSDVLTVLPGATLTGAHVDVPGVALLVAPMYVNDTVSVSKLGLCK
jgi:hypothetical protein